jgi:hypothetical protein
VKFFFPDSVDLIDPSFDFVSENRSKGRIRQRDDLYAHEVFAEPPCDGILVSKGIVDGYSGGVKYTIAQRQRLEREGVRRYFRLDERPSTRHLLTMGDCGAFSYRNELVPPFTASEVAEFYSVRGFDLGVSVDHIIADYGTAENLPGLDVPRDRERQQITLELAEEFLRISHGQCYEPIGVAQGWSPGSYRHAVDQLQRMGYRRIAIGGLVPMKTADILQVVETVSEVREAATQFHLFGISRTDHVGDFARFGVTSFDSTSPLIQAFMDDRDNYHTLDRTYAAIRVPQVGGNKLRKLIRGGQVDQDLARVREQNCLRAISEFDLGFLDVERTLEAIQSYAAVWGGDDSRISDTRKVLEDRPWKSCGCAVCASIGIHVILFRGAERNRRRGFHNLHVLYRRLQQELLTVHMCNATEVPGCVGQDV